MSRLAAAKLLDQAIALLPEDPLAPSIHHLARALRISAVVADATRVVELPIQAPQRFTSRQNPITGAVWLIHRETGERREVSVMDLASAGVEEAWVRAG